MNDVSLKAKIRNISKDKNISAQAVLQNYLMNLFVMMTNMVDIELRFMLRSVKSMRLCLWMFRPEI